MNLKYRVWDKENEEYLDSDHYMDMDGGLFTAGYWGSLQLDPDFYIIEPQIDARDIKGSEISKGDIVRVVEDGEFIFNHKVTYDEKGGCYSIDVNAGDYDITSMHWAASQCYYEYEIIGNIHQNPELLDKKE